MGERHAKRRVDPNLFRELFDRVPIGLYRTTPDGEIVEVNPAFLRMLGYSSKDELINDHAASVYVDPTARQRWLDEMDAKGTVSGFIAEWTTRDGAQIWIEENAHAVRTPDGAIRHYEGSAEDITERRATARNLAEQKARFEQLFSASPEAIVLCNNEAIVKRLNSEFETLFGYSEAEACGRSIDELLAQGIDDVASCAQQVTDAIAAGQTTFIEAQRHRKDGSLVDVSILGKPVFVDGRQIGLYAIYRDISERVSMEREIAEEKARFEQLFAASPEAIVLCNNDGMVLRANDEFFSLFGFSANEVLGHDIDQLIVSDHADMKDEAKGITQYIAAGQQSFIETQRRHKDGHLIHVSILGKPISIDGNQIAVYGIYRDITARKAAEAALAASQKKVEQLHSAADALGAADKEEDVYQITCDAAEQVLGFDLGILCIKEGDEFICQAVSSTVVLEKLGKTRVDPRGVAIQALKTGRPVIVNGPMPETLPHGIPRDSKSLICAPIADIGVFQAASPHPNVFSEEDGRLLAILLGHTAVAVSRLRLQAELIKQARHDALTGVFNRHYFNELIAQEVIRASRYDHPIGLLMIDVDRFKEINDNYGHQTGDMVLKEIADVLRATVRKSDMIVRYGGDEFLVVLTETGEDAEDAAARVRDAVISSDKLREISGFNVTVSVGHIFWHPSHGTPIEEALATADSRMYDDKRSSR